MESVVTGNNPLTWQCLLLFTSRCLKLPWHGGKRWKLASAVNLQIKEKLSDPGPETSLQQGRHERRGKKADDPMVALASRVADKLKDGDYKGAVHLACGGDSIAEHSPETLVILKQKHPDPHPDHSSIPAPDGELFSSTIKEEDVRRAIVSFPNGSAGGPDGLQPQNLKGHCFL